MKPKFFLIVLPFMLNAVMCYAQKTHIIEPAEFEITYSIKEQPFWDIYIFRCGKKASQYFGSSVKCVDAYHAMHIVLM